MAESARRLALAVRDAIDGRSLRAVADEIGVDRTTLAKVVDGRAWVDIETLARLEAGFGLPLWPGTSAPG